MVQVIGQGRVKPKSFSQQIGEGVSRLAQGVSNYGLEQNQLETQKMQQEQMYDKQIQALSKLTGIDTNGIRDPKILQAIAEHSLKNKENDLKQQSKLESIQKLGIGKHIGIGGSEDPISNMRGEGQVQNNNSNIIPDEAIYKAELMGEHGLAQQMRERNKQILSEKHHDQNVEFKKEESARKNKSMSPEYQREQQLNSAQAKVDTDYNKQLQQSASQHKIKTDTLDRLESLNKKGVTGKPYEKALEKMGLVNLTSSGRREFAADVKNLITDIRSILGSQFTGFEFQTILNAYPSADFSKDANSSIIKNLKEFQNIRHQEVEIAKNLKKENGGKIPFDFQSQVNERLQKYVNDRMPEIKSNTYQVMKEELGIPKENILMFSPDGEPLNVPATEVEKYESLGATIFPS